MINHAGERGGSKTSSPKLSLQGISPSNASLCANHIWDTSRKQCIVCGKKIFARLSVEMRIF